MTTILREPHDIFRAFVEVFPQASGMTYIDDDNAIALKISISDDQISIILHHSVDKRAFLETIQQLYQEYILRVTPPSDLSLAERSFSVAPTFSDWQTLRRIIYDQGEGSSAREVLNYITGTDTREILGYLGLMPSQITEPFAPQNTRFFVNLIKKIEKSGDTKLLDVLSVHYKGIFFHALSEIAKEELSLPTTNPFESLLLELERRVIGQRIATEYLASLLTMQEKEGSHASFLFVGPPGVGKSELAKAIGAVQDKQFIMFAMNQYPGEHDGSRFFGSPTGFIGSTSPPHFAQELMGCAPKKLGVERGMDVFEISNVVILFDELEKAHHTVRQSLLTLFNADDAYCDFQYTYGHINVRAKYKFKKSCIIATSNLFQESIFQWFENGLPVDKIETQFKELNASLMPGHPVSPFSQEFLSRVRVIPFGPIPRGENYQKIIEIKFARFLERIKSSFNAKEIIIEEKRLFFSKIESIIYERGIDLRRIDTFLEKAIANFINTHKRDWGDMATKKLVLSCTETGEPCIKIFRFILGRYIPLPIEPSHIFPLPRFREGE